MLENLRFYLHHSWNDLRVNGRRTFFALLCIAAGVAAIISLQTIANLMSSTLTDNLQATNRGDMKAETSRFFGTDATTDADGETILEPFEANGMFNRGADGTTEYGLGTTGAQKIQAWLEREYGGQVQLTYPYSITDFAQLFFGGGTGGMVTNVATGKATTQVSPYIIDPQQYPFYGDVRSLDGQALAALITQATDIVVDEKVALNLALKVGDTVQINGAEEQFTVRGIVPTDTEVVDPFSGFFAAQFGFYYLSHEALPFFHDTPARIETLYFKMTDPTPERVEQFTNAFNAQFSFFRTTTVEEVRERNQQIADIISQMVSMMGLVGLLLGSIGIINTMQVIVQRRTVEIAVLKTLGLQGGQVTRLFLTEAFMMGILGSLFGIVLSLLITLALKGVAENVVARPLPFKIVPNAILNGVFVGTLVTTIFGFMPTLSAGNVRPGIVLRPNDQIIPRSGCLQTSGALLIVMIALGLVATPLLGNPLLAFGGTLGVFIVAGLFLLAISVVLWLIGKLFPAFVVDIKIAKRQLLATRRRAAITVLSLVIGVFSLSSITLAAQAINNVLRISLTDGGNVMVMALNPLLINLSENAAKNVVGVRKTEKIEFYQASVTGVIKRDGTTVDKATLIDQIAAQVGDSFFMDMMADEGDSGDIARSIAENTLDTIGTLATRDVTRPFSNTAVEGRLFQPEDAGQHVVILTKEGGMERLGLEVGDQILYQFGQNAPLAYKIIGFVNPAITTSFNGQYFVPTGAIPASAAVDNAFLLVDIPEENIPALRQAISRVPGVFALELAALNKLVMGLLGTFTAFPTMVALLGLVVGGIVIANSVALATLERKREIAILKAVGLQRERVLGMLLWENLLLGLVGGLIGVGLGLLALTLAFASVNGLVAVPYDLAGVLMGLCIFVALVAALTTAWSASGEKPLNVLRYE